MNKMTIVFLVFCVVLLSITAYITRVKPYMDKFNRMKQNEVYRDTTYLVMQGGTTTFGGKGLNNPWLNYRLHSWDAGKNWYAVDYDFDTQEFKILGVVDTVYPGLLNHLKAWDKMTEYARKYGPIKLDDADGLKLMEDAGFTISK